MDPVFTLNEYTIKRKGLGIAGKHLLFGNDLKTPLLYIDEKSTLVPLTAGIHLFSDADKTHEVLTLGGNSDCADMSVIDTLSGAKLGRISMAADNMKEFVKDYWSIHDSSSNLLAKFGERSVGRALLREIVAHDITQRVDVLVGETVVAEFRQKSKMIGYELYLNFSMDINHLLDRRLGIAAAVYVANHQAQEVDW